VISPINVHGRRPRKWVAEEDGRNSQVQESGWRRSLHKKNTNVVISLIVNNHDVGRGFDPFTVTNLN
jgi:hypothetical protein